MRFSIVFFSNGTKAKINQAKLNLYTQEIHYLSATGNELAVENEGVIQLVFLNKEDLTKPIASFAKLNNHIGNAGISFYRIFNPGLYQLVLLQNRFVKTSAYDPIQAKSVSSFYTKNNYAIYNEGKIIPLRDLDKTSVLAVIPLNSLTSDWLNKSKSKLKSEKEIVEYLEQVNLSYTKVN